MVRLVVAPCQSASELRRGLSPGQADEHGQVDGDDLVVEDADAAAALVEQYPNVRHASDDEPAAPTDREPARMEADNDGVGYVCGVNGCSRDVDDADATCWQHDETED